VTDIFDLSAFTHYIALGDSASMDLFPALDAGDIDVAVALERSTAAGRVAPLGAASLLYQNNEERWPDEIGNDLVSANPSIIFQNLATAEGTIGDVFAEQLPQVEETDEPVLLTLTIGANDLLSAYGNRPKRALLEKIEQDVAEAYDFLVDLIRGRFSAGTLVVNTLFDPSDRGGRIPGVYDELGPLPLDIVDRFNDHIRALAVGTPRVLLADLYARFLGHGLSAPEAERWYWRRSLVEPNAQGASEIRHLWLETLQGSDAR
jgi:lysophospholipase L1-like esterase